MKLSGPFFRVNRSLSRALQGAILGVFAVLGCSGDNGPTAIEIPIARIDITSPCRVVIEGFTCQIGVTAFAEDGRQIANPVLRYLTRDSSVADVTANGLVTGRLPGNTMIEVTNSTNSVRDDFPVAVLPQYPTGD